ncbi:hypothetical protein RAMDARK_0871 [Rickettsia amblyommatis str. Darkwater]|nr:hypothetical protein RAMDARK_0871 [Rickettsia amblyommatis str. Darkwater]
MPRLRGNDIESKDQRNNIGLTTHHLQFVLINFWLNERFYE